MQVLSALLNFIFFLIYSFTQQEAPESKDHSLILRYPSSYIHYYEQKEFDDFEILVNSTNTYKGDGYIGQVLGQ